MPEKMKYLCVDNGKIVSLYRLCSKDGGLFPERWDPKTKKWVFYPALMRETYIGLDSDFEEISEEEIMKFINSHS